MSEPLSLKDAFEVIDANEVYADKLQRIPIKAYIVRKHELHIPFCVFKLSDLHPFRCVTCMLEKELNADCIHVQRVRMDYPFHVHPKEYPESEEEIKKMLDAVRVFENVLLGPLDTHVVKYFNQVMYLKGTAFKPKSVHSFVSQEQKRLVALEETVWDGIHLLFLIRNNRRFALNNMMGSKIQFTVLVENVIRETKEYNEKVKKAIALHHEEEEKAAEIYLSKVDEGSHEDEEEDEKELARQRRERIVEYVDDILDEPMEAVYPELSHAMGLATDSFLERYLEASIAFVSRMDKASILPIGENCSLREWMHSMKKDMGQDFSVQKALEIYGMRNGFV